MTVAYDAASAPGGLGNVSGTELTTDLSWTHTPVGTPRGVLLFVGQGAGSSDEISAAPTYGGVAMSEISGSPNAKAAAESGIIYGYFLGSSIPTGAQTVSVTVAGATGKVAVCFTVTAATDTTIQDTDASINSDSATNPTAVLSLGGLNCFVAQAFLTGIGTYGAGNVQSGFNRDLENDYGAFEICIQRYTTVDTADVTCGIVQTSEDAVLLAAAVTEAVAGGGGNAIAWISA